jgi:hypothetical protein
VKSAATSSKPRPGRPPPVWRRCLTACRTSAPSAETGGAEIVLRGVVFDALEDRSGPAEKAARVPSRVPRYRDRRARRGRSRGSRPPHQRETATSTAVRGVKRRCCRPESRACPRCSRLTRKQVVGIHKGLEARRLCARLGTDEELRAPAPKRLRSLERQVGVEPGILDGGDEADPGGIACQVPVHILDGDLHRGLAGLSQGGPVARQREKAAEQHIPLARLGGALARGQRGGHRHQRRDCAAETEASSNSSQVVGTTHGTLRIRMGKPSSRNTASANGNTMTQARH